MSLFNLHYPHGQGENMSERFNLLEIKQKNFENNTLVPLHIKVEVALLNAKTC